MSSIVLFCFVIFVALSLVSYHVSDPSFNRAGGSVENLTGTFGAYLSDTLFQIMGISAFLLPVALAVISVRLFQKKPVIIYWDRLLAFPTLLIVVSILAALISSGTAFFPSGPGGMIGRMGATLLTQTFGHWGSVVLLFPLGLFSSLIVMRLSLVAILEKILEKREKLKEETEETEKTEETTQKPKKKTEKPEKIQEILIPDDPPPFKPERSEPMLVVPKLPPIPSSSSTMKNSVPLPPFDLIGKSSEDRPPPDQKALSLRATLLEEKLAEFRIEGKIREIRPGPVVTTFELEPKPGLKASKVVGVSDDLARSIMAISVRVVGNIPGKNLIGIEIPNDQRQTVHFRDILESAPFQNAESLLTVALGSDITGHPVVADLAKMPHLLVAGTTGSGKSVAVNTMIASVLFRATPDQVRFLMVDPKMLELSVYEGIPHLLAPVVTDVRKASNLLKWAVSEMESRYQLMSELGVRNIVGYNQRIERCLKNGEQPTRKVRAGFDPETGQPLEREEPIPLERLPLILIIIDELADLMMVVGKEVEPAIARLAQMARAAGLHLILATQRPSVDVITGLIKANFPTRLSFQVSSRIDSRTILDTQGAETLLGMGDGLFMPPGTPRLQRIHAPFISDGDIHQLVAFLKKTGKPEYLNAILATQEEEDSKETDGFSAGVVGAGVRESGDEDHDELYDRAVATVIKARKVSVSMVQRHFKIGYNRAARMVEQMEKEGLISEADGAGKRKILTPSQDS